MKRLDGKTALLIGCSPNIGRSIARIFACEGASVVVNDVNEPSGRETVALIERDGGTAAFHPADIASNEGLAEVVAFAASTFGRLDVFVSLANAGESRSVMEFDREAAELCYAVNVLALIEGTRRCVPHMERVGGGSVVSISSIQGIRGTGHSPGYAAAKAGIIGAAQSMALELWPRKIRVNVLCPTAVTGLAWRVVDEIGWEALPEYERRFGSELRHLPGGVVIDPMALGYAALFLASDESNFITGAAIPVDAAMSVMHYGAFVPHGDLKTPNDRRARQEELERRCREWIDANKTSR